MSPEHLFAQTTRELPAALMRGTVIAPTLLPVCCVCGLIRDDKSCASSLDCWLTRSMYREAHGIDPTETALTHTYCPACFAKAQGTVRQYFREIGSAP